MIKWVCNAQTLWMTFINLSTPCQFKTKICFGCTFMYYMQVLSVSLLCNEGIVNIQVLCSIPLAWTWRYCQWYWQCLHIQIKGALITCINHCHLLELTLLCLVDLWKLDESISNFKGAWCIYFYFISYRHTCTCKQRMKILIIRRVLRRLIWACTVCLCPFLQDTMHK